MSKNRNNLFPQHALNKNLVFDFHTGRFVDLFTKNFRPNQNNNTNQRIQQHETDFVKYPNFKNTSDPGSGNRTAGDWWYNTSSGEFEYYDGNVVKILQTGGSQLLYRAKGTIELTSGTSAITINESKNNQSATANTDNIVLKTDGITKSEFDLFSFTYEMKRDTSLIGFFPILIISDITDDGSGNTDITIHQLDQNHNPINFSDTMSNSTTPIHFWIDSRTV